MRLETLLAETRERLLLRTGKYVVIARHHHEIGYSWMTKFANGEITNPTVLRLSALIDALDEMDAQDAKSKHSD